MSLLVTWWSVPIDNSQLNRFDSVIFGARNLAPLGYAAFGFMLGVTLGLLIRRTLPAMDAILGAFLGVRLAFTYLARPHLLAPRNLVLPLAQVADGFGTPMAVPKNVFVGAPTLPNAGFIQPRPSTHTDTH
ncbi:MAG: hypothetical protein M3N95_11405 [Actinomycetota bacterium]|nr:hypothetical protein [Actinomycetota bacterium]